MSESQGRPVTRLPVGWESWPRADLEELLTGLESLAAERSMGRGPWLCDISDCDGKPHPGRRNPHSRADQRAPEGDQWDVWNLLAGRGFGKTRTGAEWALDQARTYPRGALVGPTAADVRDVMVEGESGILACARGSFRPIYEPSKRRLTYPNGATQHCYSADEPNRLRGPQHFYFWADELAAWRYLQESWDMLQMGLRLGDHPRGCVTTTPRPLPLIKRLVKDPRVHTVRGSTYDNLHNLAPTFRRAVLDRYEGTTLGRQELYADILEDLPGALIRRADIDAARVSEAPDLDLVVVAVDPAGTGTGDEAGIVVVGRGSADKNAYVLADYSGRLTARETGRKAWSALEEHDASYLVYEDNFGKQWLRDGLIDAYPGVKADAHRMLHKVTAQHGKHLRAQPVAMRYEQHKVHHVGVFPELEDQACTWDPHEDSDSPDRVDALVHGVTFLLRREKNSASMVSPHAVGLGRAMGRSTHPFLRRSG